MDEEPITRKDLRDMEERISERIEASETRLLSAFHGWPLAMEIRVRGNTTMVTGFDERLSLVEERISELERKQRLAG
jgi:hypothetical protein